MCLELIERALEIVTTHDWSQSHKSADVDGFWVPIWDTRVKVYCLSGALERAAFELELGIPRREYETLNWIPVIDRLSRYIVNENLDQLSQYPVEPTRTIVWFNDKKATCKEDVVQLLERFLKDMNDM